MSGRRCKRCPRILRSTQRSDLCELCQREERELKLRAKADQSEIPRKKETSEGNLIDYQEEKVYTVDEYSKRFGYSKRRIREKLIKKEIIGFKLPGGRKWFIPEKNYIQEDKISFLQPTAETDLSGSLSKLQQAVEILVHPDVNRDGVKRASQLLKEIPFLRETARLYELYLAPDSPQLTPKERLNVLEGFQRIFDLNWPKEDPLSTHLTQRVIHWLARSGVEDFVLTVKKLYQGEKHPLIQRGMMLGLVLSGKLDPEEYLNTFFTKEANQLLDIFIYQIRAKDARYSTFLQINDLLKSGEVNIQSKFENSLRSLLSELNDPKRNIMGPCSFRTLSSILFFGKEKALKDFKKVISDGATGETLKSILSTQNLGLVWRKEAERLKQYIRKDPDLKRTYG